MNSCQYRLEFAFETGESYKSTPMLGKFLSYSPLLQLVPALV